MTRPVMHCGCGYDDCTACAGCGWACVACGAAFFGTAPEDGMCSDCAAADGAPAAPGRSAERGLSAPAAPSCASSHARTRQPVSGALSAVENQF
jgi:hypothetical protein